MTNAEKYCPNSNISELENLFRHYNNYVLTREWAHNPRTFREFLKEETKPTLTEDERVILRNIDKRYKYIGRTDYDARIQYLYVNIEDGWKPHIIEEFDHLFKFIKERRRI